MLVENQTVIIKWNKSNKDYYESKGYILDSNNREIEVAVEDLTKGSSALVKVMCDYCGEMVEKTYNIYNKQHHEKYGDCCAKCQPKKNALVCQEKYGVSNAGGIESAREKAINTSIERYGVDNPAKAEEIKQKITDTLNDRYGTDRRAIIEKCIATNLERYGCENASQAEEVKEKINRTMFEKYGAIRSTCTEEIKEKVRNTLIENYGVDNPMHSKELIEKIKETNKEKYGVEWTLQNAQVRAKSIETMLEHGHVYTSKQQIALNAILCEMYGNSVLNYRCGKYVLDSMIEVNGIKIDIEYDGAYWHNKMKQHDEERNDYVISKGFKVLRFVAEKKQVPTNTLIESSVNELINSDKNILIVTL